MDNTPPVANLFCTNCGNSVADNAVACMSCGARPIGHKKFCRQCGTGLNPEQVICIKCGTELTDSSGVGDVANSVAVPRATAVPLDAQRRKARIHFWSILCIVSFVICMLASLLLELSFYAIELSEINLDQFPVDAELPEDIVLPEDVVRWFLPVYFAIIVFVPIYMVSFYMFLHWLWDEIPSEFARTTPEKAAGFMFIPLWNVYWMFVAFWGLYKDMNKTTESRGLGSRFDEPQMQLVCCKWVTFFIVIGIGYHFGIFDIILETIFGDRGRNFAFAVFVLLSVAYAWLTVNVYWSIRKDVLEFIDIKASGGEIANTRAAGGNPPVGSNQHTQKRGQTSAFQSTRKFELPIARKIKSSPKPETPATLTTIIAVALSLLFVYGAFYGITFYRERAEVNRFLEYHGVNPGAVSGNDANRLFHHAVRDGNVPVMKFLVSKGANVNTGDWSPLHSAVHHNNISMARFFISNGADVNRSNMGQITLDGRMYSRLTPLHVAVIRDNVSMARFLISEGAVVDAKCDDDVRMFPPSLTPLHLAARHDNISMVRFLVSEGADVNARNRRGQTPLDVARTNNRTEIVEFLSNIR